MIYTLTCNPALDCSVRLGSLQEGKINLVDGCDLTPGGKGVNVSRVLTAMGEANVALGFVAGGNGSMLESALQKMGLTTAFTHLDEGQTRINVKLYGDSETELNAPGPEIPLEALERLERQLREWVKPADVVCLCGSLAPGLPADTYGRLVRLLRQLGVTETVVDTTGGALLAALPERPWLIKPNREELAALVGRPLPTLADVVDAARELMDKGAQNALITLGRDGAILCTADGCRYQPAPEGKVVGTVGAGDSTVAGFMRGYIDSDEWEEALRVGVACGSATAFAPGLATLKEIRAVLKRLPDMQQL